MKYDKENRLAGTFFFSEDPSHDPERRSLDRIVATIAYQSSISHPVIKKKVIEVLNSDPAILSSALETQFQSLLIGPFRPSGNTKFIRSFSVKSIALVLFSSSP